MERKLNKVFPNNKSKILPIKINGAGKIPVPTKPKGAFLLLA